MRSQANAYGAPDVDDNSRGAQLAAKFNQRYQFYLDKSVPHLQQRWAAWGGVAYAEGVKCDNPKISPSLKVPSVLPSGGGFRLQKNPRTRLDCLDSKMSYLKLNARRYCAQLASDIPFCG